MQEEKQRLVSMYYSLTNNNYDNIGYAKSMNVVADLLQDYTEQEIAEGILHFVTYPPKNGFYSIMFLKFGMPQIINKIRAKIIKESQKLDLPEQRIINKTTSIKPAKPNKRVQGFDFMIFEGENDDE